MNTFDQANDSLRHDLVAYADSLRTLVAALPRARALCDQVQKEVRLAQALLAFGSGPLVSELNTSLYTISNLWPYRERTFARTLGFSEEIAEAETLREEALKGIRTLARRTDSLGTEVTTCLAAIARLLEEEQVLLEQCDASIRPHAEQMELTRKRLNLLVATVDARMPDSDDQRFALRAYGEAAELMRAWENGVPMDEQGVDILERCIEILNHAGASCQTVLSAAQP